MEKLLSSSKFIRIHKSVIVSRAAVTAIRKDHVSIGNVTFSIGDTYSDVIAQLIAKIS